jgi:tRNA(Ile)-lysidine synthase
VVERLIELVDQEGKKLSLPERLTALNEAGKLALYRQGRLTFKQNLILGKLGRLQIPRLNFKARVADGGLSSIITQLRSRKVAVDLERVSLPLVVRSLKPGDRFRPLGMAGSKKLSDYLIDAKWPAYLRDEVALVCDQKGIVWVAGLQIEDRVKITSKTKRVLFLEFSRRNQD